MDIENTISDAEITPEKILVENTHIQLTDETRGDNLTNRCLTTDVRETGFYLKGWRAGCYVDVDAIPASGSAVEIYHYTADGALEIDFVLDTPPTSNIFLFAIDSHNLDFFYQPALTQDEIDEGIERPENIVGSYAVYYSNKQHDYSYSDGSQINYGTGKFCHIYRPYAVDANGIQVWCDLNVDIDTSTLFITVPQDFLDTAVYPVRVDPIFGTTTIGGTNANLNTNNQGAAHTVMTSDTNASTQAIVMYNRSQIGTGTVKYALYTDTGTHPDTLLDITTLTASNTTAAQWRSLDLVGSAALTANATYWLCIAVATQNCRYYYDAGNAGDFQTKNGAGATWTNPWGTTSTSNAYSLSIYCVYRVAETKTINSDAKVYGLKTINSDAKVYGLKTINSGAWIKHFGDIATINSDAKIYGLNTLSSNATIKGLKTINSTAKVYSYNTVVPVAGLYKYDGFPPGLPPLLQGVMTPNLALIDGDLLTEIGSAAGYSSGYEAFGLDLGAPQKVNKLYLWDSAQQTGSLTAGAAVIFGSADGSTWTQVGASLSYTDLSRINNTHTIFTPTDITVAYRYWAIYVTGAIFVTSPLSFTELEAFDGLVTIQSNATIYGLKTISSDARIERFGDIDTLSSDANIKRFDDTTSINSDTKVYGINTLSSDATIKGFNTINSDATIQVSETKTLSSDATIQVSETSTLSSNAVIQVFKTKTLDSDATIQVSETKTLDSDAIIQVSGAVSIDSDSIIQVSKAVSLDSDTTIQVSETSTLDSDATIQVSEFITIDSDGHIWKTYTAQISSAGVIWRPDTELADSDAIIQVSEFTTLDSDGIIYVSEFTTIPSDTIIYGLDILSSDATIQVSEFITLSSDAIIQVSEFTTLDSDATIQVSKTSTLDSDTTIQVSEAVSIDSDSIIQVSELTTLSSDGISQVSEITTADAGGHIQVSEAVVIDSDTTIQVSEFITIDSDAVAQVFEFTTIDTDATIQVSETSTLDSDTTIQTSEFTTISSDSRIMARSLGFIQGPISDLHFSTSTTYGTAITNVTDSIYAIVYQSAANNTTVQTFPVDDTGHMSAVISENQVAASACTHPDFVQVYSDIFGVIYADGDGNITLVTFSIDSNGIVGDQIDLKIFGIGSSNPTIIQSPSGYFILVTGVNGQEIITLAISHSGIIDSIVSSLAMPDFYSPGTSLLNVSDDVYAYCSADANGLGQIYTFSVDESGALANIDSYTFESVNGCRFPHILHVAGDIFVIHYYSTLNTYGNILTLTIYADGNIVESIIDFNHSYIGVIGQYRFDVIDDMQYSGTFNTKIYMTVFNNVIRSRTIDENGIIAPAPINVHYLEYSDAKNARALHVIDNIFLVSHDHGAGFIGAGVESYELRDPETVSSDAVIYGLDILSSDTTIQVSEVVSTDSDSIIYGINTLDSDAIIQVSETTTIDSDGDIQVSALATLDSDTTIQVSEAVSIDSDSIIQVSEAVSLDSDTIIYGLNTLDSDTTIQVSEAVSIDSNADIKLIATINSDGHIQTTETAPIQSDAVIGVILIHSDAVIYQIPGQAIPEAITTYERPKMFYPADSSAGVRIF